MILGFLLVLHLLGAFFWVGGFSAAAWMLRRREGSQGAAPWERLERDFLFKGGYAGMGIVLLSGTGLIAASPEYFLRQGWLHAKLACVALLTALSVLLALAREKGPLGAAFRSRAALFQGGFWALVCAVLLLAVLRPF